MRMKGYLDDTMHYAFHLPSQFLLIQCRETREMDLRLHWCLMIKIVMRTISASKMTTLFGISPRNLISQKLCHLQKTKVPSSEPHKLQSSFGLGMNLILKDGKGNTVSVVYEGVAADGLAPGSHSKDQGWHKIASEGISFDLP